MLCRHSTYKLLKIVLNTTVICNTGNIYTSFGLFQVRPIVFEDFDEALHQVRASVSEKDLDLYIKWNKLYGSGTK